MSHRNSKKLTGVHILADDHPRWGRDPVEQGEAALRGGARVIQLRAKHAGDKETLYWAKYLRKATLRHGALFLLNDRFDLALLAEADGVHLGQEDLTPARLPASVRKRLLVGLSTHEIEQVDRARSQPVDYVAYGPIFGTDSKKSSYSPRGIEQLSKVVSTAKPLLLVAIGGIGLQDASKLRRLGVDGIAVIGAVAGASDPIRATRDLVAAFSGRETSDS